MHAFIVGGAGFIGSVTAHLFINEGHKVTILDNLSTGSKKNIPNKASFISGSVLDEYALNKIFMQNQFDIVLDFAAKIRVDESIILPQVYIETNVNGVVKVLTAMANHKVESFIFSSSAAVYGNPDIFPIAENAIPNPLNPYGYSKLMAEMACKAYQSSKNINWIGFRFFNVAGAYKGILPSREYPAQLIPALVKAAREGKVFDLYKAHTKTKDGTSIRDFIHVKDIARAHLLAATRMVENKQKFNQPINLGSGSELTILDILNQLEEVGKRKISFKLKAPRRGDPTRSVADISLARKYLGWKPEFNMRNILEDIWDN